MSGDWVEALRPQLLDLFRDGGMHEAKEIAAKLELDMNRCAALLCWASRRRLLIRVGGAAKRWALAKNSNVTEQSHQGLQRFREA